MPSNWLPLPTHSGRWWKYQRDSVLISIRVIVEATDPMDGEGLREDGAFYAGVLKERESVRWKECVPPPPPADAETLPRRFRWKGMNCVQWPSGEIDCEDGDVYMHVPMLAEEWIAERADEIEWID